jgi:hypothetical protein
MTIVTAANCSAGLGNTIVVSYATQDPSAKISARASAFRGQAASRANIEKGTLYVSAASFPYSPELAALFGGDDI